VPTGFQLGVYSKIWAPLHSRAPKKFSGKQNFFRKIPATGGEGGGGRRYFLKTKVHEIFRQTTFFQKFAKFSAKKSFIFKKFCNSSMPGPPLRTLGPLFTFLGGMLHPPRWHGPVARSTYASEIKIQTSLISPVRCCGILVTCQPLIV
jgi:hypothetical protein